MGNYLIEKSLNQEIRELRNDWIERWLVEKSMICRDSKVWLVDVFPVGEQGEYDEEEDHPLDQILVVVEISKVYINSLAVGYFPYNIKSLQVITLQHNIPTFFCPYK